MVLFFNIFFQISSRITLFAINYLLYSMIRYAYFIICRIKNKTNYTKPFPCTCQRLLNLCKFGTLLQKITEKNVDENVPYDLRKYNTGAAVICGEENGFDYALIEIRDDEFDNLEQGANEWSDILANLLKRYLQKQ